MRATVVAPRILPMMMEVLWIGATIISLRKPKSLSERTDMPALVAENIRFIQTRPGIRNKI